MVTAAKTLFTLDRGIKRVLGLNLLVGAGFLVAYGLKSIGLPYLTPLFGAISFFLPGFNLALAFEQFTRRREGISTILLWSFIFSLTITPAVIYFLGQTIFNSSPALFPIPPFAVWWVLTGALLFASSLISRIPAGFMDTRIRRGDRRELLFLLGAFLVIMLANFLLYRYIPEADGYSYLIKLERAEIIPTILSAEPRILFLQMTNLLAKLLSIDPYWVLKVVLPLFYFVVVAAVYSIARPLIKQPWLRVLVALSPFFFPIILQEALISRPQSVAVLSLVPALYLTGKVTTERAGNRNIVWLATLIAIGIIGIRIHVLFLLLSLLGLAGIIATMWPTARKHRLYALLIAEVLTFLGLLWLENNRLIYDLEYLARLLFSTLREGRFDFWFIDHYRNIDGSEVGWPGWSALLYYGYNLGLFLPSIFLFLRFSRKPPSWRSVRRFLWPAVGVLALFFIVAEILPRLGLAFLPDRAWLLIAFSLALLTPYLLTIVSRNRKVFASLIIVGAISLMVGTGVTYAKQGWVTPEEYEAGVFIKRHTPEHAIFISQSGNQILLNYFAKRLLVVPPADFFLGDDNQFVADYVPRQGAAVYVIYSERKFDSLYAQRAWWREANFFGADTEKFSRLYPTVYDQDGVTIWEVRK